MNALLQKLFKKFFKSNNKRYSYFNFKMIINIDEIIHLDYANDINLLE